MKFKGKTWKLKINEKRFKGWRKCKLKPLVKPNKSTPSRQGKIIRFLEDPESYENDQVRFLRKAVKEDFMYNGSFHEAIAPVLVMAQLFGVMPVKGIKSKDVNDLSFSWKYFRTIYSIFVMFGVIFYTALVIIWIAESKIEFDKIEPLIFNFSNTFVLINFLTLAKRWPELMKKWDSTERSLPPYNSQMDKAKLANRIKLVTFVAMMLSLTEHVLHIISVVHYANYCPVDINNPIESFFRSELDRIFYFFDYSPSLAFFGKYLNITMTFTWNFMDVFVMIMSIAIAMKFKQINDNLMKYKNQPMPELFWMDQRIQYRNICLLCNEIDGAMSFITMISFSNNLYFICIQLLKSLNKMPSVGHAVYFWFSLLFLLGRTLAVSLFAAEIHDQSKVPLQVFRCVPKESWCSEIKRFCHEVSTDTVALTGMRFFHITRKLVLSVAGTIVTYELVLIQFHEDKAVTMDCNPSFNLTSR